MKSAGGDKNKAKRCCRALPATPLPEAAAGAEEPQRGPGFLRGAGASLRPGFLLLPRYFS